MMNPLYMPTNNGFNGFSVVQDSVFRPSTVVHKQGLTMGSTCSRRAQKQTGPFLLVFEQAQLFDSLLPGAELLKPISHPTPRLAERATSPKTCRWLQGMIQ